MFQLKHHVTLFCGMLTLSSLPSLIQRHIHADKISPFLMQKQHEIPVWQREDSHQAQVAEQGDGTPEATCKAGNI